ncbi:MAG: hypothetical protein LBU94_00160 [Clostridiales bacterium]|jgi:hypothetical protein|nr:hypothetical protein [Clostridiales bacterium]
MDENNNGNNNYQSNPGSFTQQPSEYDARPPFYQPEMTVKDWLITLLIMVIPCVNIIMLFVWAFSSGGNETRRTFAKAYLIFMAIMIVVSIIFSFFVGGIIASTMNSMVGY